MSQRLYYLLSALIGLVCGLITAYSFLSHSWSSVIFWAIVALAIGFFGSDRHEAYTAGTIYGFFLIGAWFSSIFQGTFNQIFEFTFLALFLCLVGAFFGNVLAVIAQWTGKKICC